MGSWFAMKIRQKLGAEPSVSHDDKLIRYAKTRGIFIIFHLLPDLERSFCWQILLLVFGNVYGIASIYASRWKYTPSTGVDGSENAMGFGQYVALLLLMLPLMAATEAYEGQFGEILWVVRSLTQP